jgi:hypothetical protein
MSAASVFEQLGCRLKSVRQSWAGEGEGRAAFTVWADEVRREGNGLYRYILHPTRDRRERPEGFRDADDRFGSIELRGIAERALASGAECFGVIIKAADVNASTREREWCDTDFVYRMRLERDGDSIVARMTAKVRVSEVAKE